MNENKSKSIVIGEKAPDFTATVQNPLSTETITLSTILSQNTKVLLVFYPGDDTSGCTAQLCGIRDIYKEFTDLGVLVLGVNPADSQSHLNFINKYSYPFGIVVDSDKSIREKYGAIGNFYGKIITRRCVFLIDTDSTVIFRHFGQQDNNKILDLLKTLTK